MGTYNGNEPFVFVSYAHKDSAIVLPIIQGLQNRGFRVWYDEGIEVGNEWPDFIAEHLERSACVLVFVSRNFGESHNCRQEFTFSQNLHKDNSIVYLEDPNLLRAGLRMQLSNLHALYYKEYRAMEDFLNELSAANVLKPCLAAAAEPVRTPVPAPAKPAEPSAEELYQQALDLDGKKEYEKAFLLYKKAAEQGHAKAQFHLGLRYDAGLGVAQNREEAVKWYRKAADQGDVSAQFNLGVCYMRGNGVAKNQEEAVKWYRKAAEQGHAEAQYMLSYCYKHGFGVQMNKQEARKWYQKAAYQGDEDAAEALKTL